MDALTQEAKVSQGGGASVRYRTGLKGRWVAEFKDLLARRLPYCRVEIRLLSAPP